MPSDEVEATRRSTGTSSHRRLLGLLLTIALLIFVPLSVSGLPHTTSLLLSLLLLLSISSYGAAWTLAIGRPVGAVEWVGVGVAGTFMVPTLLAIVLAPVTPPLGARVASGAAWLVGPAFVGLIILLRRRRAWGTWQPTADWIPVVGAVLASCIAIALNRWQFPRYSLTPPIDYSAFHPDMLWFQSMATANSLGDVGMNGVMADWPARYHWFSFAWVGSIESAGNLEPFVVSTRVLPILATIGSAFLAAAWTRRLSRSRFLPGIVALLVTCGRLPHDSTAVVINWDSPSQTASTPLLIFAALGLTELLRSRRPRGLVAIIAAAAFTLAGFKVSAAAVLVAGVIFAAAAGLVRASPWRHRVYTSTVVIVLAVAAAFLAFMTGQAGGGGLIFHDVSGTGTGVVSSISGAAATSLAFVAGWLGLGYLAWRRPTRLEFPTWFAVGAALGALVPMWVLTDGGPNTRWFMTSATAITWVVSAAGAFHLLTRPPLLSSACTRVVVGVAGLAALVAALLWGVLFLRFDLPPVTAQIAFLGLLLLLASGAGALLSPTLGTPTRRSIALVVVWGGLLAPLAMLPAERVLPIWAAGTWGVSPTGPAQSADGVDTDSVPPAEPTASPAEVASLSALLATRAQNGDVVAISDYRLLPALFPSRTRPLATWAAYATDLGPEGSDAEFARRESALRNYLSGGDPASLCAWDVKWVVVRSPEGLRLDPTYCD